ncbi:uncharacterized protein LOC143301443 [Babylonia areolata]|uniref:uncharacterized protein LOC143301443 n=1 Tax=Babylonia areolata TaxID=304850 RepID=UPI003FD14CCD
MLWMNSALLLLLLLCLHSPLRNTVTATPADDWSDKRVAGRDRLVQDRQAYFRVLEALLKKLQEVRRKRTRPDGGFFSRHDAMNDYLQSAYASELASDPYGPGKRK